MKIFTPIQCAQLIILFTGSLLGQQPTGREILEQYKSQDRTADLSVELQMTLFNARGDKRERQVTQVTKTDADDNRKTLVRFQSPADVKGTGFLSIEYGDRDDDTWLYLPALRKARRISSSDRTDSFMGSEFTYEDMEPENLEAFDYKLNGSEPVEGIDAWIVEATPTDRATSGYSKRVLWVSKDHFVLLQVKYYDSEGAYSKVLRSGEIRQVPGTDKWRPHYLTMENVRSGKKTVLEFSDYKINQNVPDSYFSQRYLKRGR